MASGKMDVTSLISHRFPIEEAAEAYDLITEMKTPFLGVLLKYAENAPVERKITIESTKNSPSNACQTRHFRCREFCQCHDVAGTQKEWPSRVGEHHLWLWRQCQTPRKEIQHSKRM